ncbi:MAG: hypothetical protein U0237_18080 [Thermoleophilia bacterium]
MTRSPADSVKALVVGIAVVAFLVAWAVLAGRPWEGPAAVPPRDPRMVALDRWEARLDARAIAVEAAVRRRWSDYQRRLRARLERTGMLELPPGPVIARRRAGAPPILARRPAHHVVWTKAS